MKSRAFFNISPITTSNNFLVKNFLKILPKLWNSFKWAADFKWRNLNERSFQKSVWLLGLFDDLIDPIKSSSVSFAGNNMVVGSPPELSTNAQNEAHIYTTHISVTMAAAGKKKANEIFRCSLLENPIEVSKFNYRWCQQICQQIKQSEENFNSSNSNPLQLT